MKKLVLLCIITIITLTDFAIGKKITNSKIKMLNGEYAKLYDFNKDGLAIINFWTTWWAFCERQLAYIDQLNTHFKDYGLNILAVNTNKPNILNLVRPYINKRKYKFQVAVDPRAELAKKFNVRATPALFIIDRDGTIIHKSAGYESGMEYTYLEKILDYYQSEDIDVEKFEYDKSQIEKYRDSEIRFDF